MASLRHVFGIWQNFFFPIPRRCARQPWPAALWHASRSIRQHPPERRTSRAPSSPFRACRMRSAFSTKVRSWPETCSICKARFRRCRRTRRWRWSSSSGGGSLGEGIALGKFFYRAKIITIVNRGTGCHSACSLAFLGGRSAKTGQPMRIKSSLGLSGISSVQPQVRSQQKVYQEGSRRHGPRRAGRYRRPWWITSNTSTRT